MTHWEDFFAQHLPPTDFEDNRKLLQEFTERHAKLNNKIVLVTVSFSSDFPWKINWPRFNQAFDIRFISVDFHKI